MISRTQGYEYQTNKTYCGFTLIELIIVLIILSILSIVALPRFIDFQTDALKIKRKEITITLESLINQGHAKSLLQQKEGHKTSLNNFIKLLPHQSFALKQSSQLHQDFLYKSIPVENKLITIQGEYPSVFSQTLAGNRLRINKDNEKDIPNIATYNLLSMLEIRTLENKATSWNENKTFLVENKKITINKNEIISTNQISNRKNMHILFLVVGHHCLIGISQKKNAKNKKPEVSTLGECE